VAKAADPTANIRITNGTNRISSSGIPESRGGQRPANANPERAQSKQHSTPAPVKYHQDDVRRRYAAFQVQPARDRSRGSKALAQSRIRRD
jgi:hypothetical protein